MTMSNFALRHVARIDFPDKHIVICEDDILCQKQIIDHFNDIFERQGKVRITLLSGTIELAHILSQYCYYTWEINLIILDHDLPYGNGIDFLKWIKKQPNIEIPIMTFSGQPINNRNMMKLGANYEFTKDEVIQGRADEIIKNILFTEVKENALCI